MLQLQIRRRDEKEKQKQQQLWLLDQFNLIGRCAISCILVLLTHFTLSLVPRFISACSLLLQLPLSGVVLLLVVGFGRWCRRLVGASASAPAFVFFNILFIWGIFILLVRNSVPPWVDVIFNGEVFLLLVGLCSILSSDPGAVTSASPNSDQLDETEAFVVEAHNEGSMQLLRIRYCKNCKAYIKGFDHHCPAFGNCIGEKNHVLFMALLVGFLVTEVSYVACLSHFTGGSFAEGRTIFASNLAGNFIISTMLFSILQVLWQVVFLTWHIYCICFNIRTDEWINWKKYPEFQLLSPSQQGENLTEMRRFTNPYHKGILANLKEFLVEKRFVLKF